MIRKPTVTIMHSYLICSFKLKKKNNCNNNKTQCRFTEEGLKTFKQITKDSTLFNNSFTQQSNSINFQKQYDQWEKKLDSVLYTCFKKYQKKKNALYLSARTKLLIKIKKEQSKISRKGKSERIISQNTIKKIENLLQGEVISMDTKRIKNALLEKTFHEKFNIKNSAVYKRMCSKMICNTNLLLLTVSEMSRKNQTL